jgi:enterochelin esterase-like enzyme
MCRRLLAVCIFVVLVATAAISLAIPAPQIPGRWKVELDARHRESIAGDEFKFTREPGDFAAQQLVAQRQRDGARQPPRSERRQRRGQPRPIVLGPDDKPAFPAAPAGFDAERADVPRGNVATVQYDSRTVGNMRKALVYTPPGYSPDATYPVLYLLHGIGDDETGWNVKGQCQTILDNLYAEGKLAPMIVVMPNGRAQPNDRVEGNVFQSAPAFETFERDLLTDLIPFVEARYPARKERESRAVAGLSMGGGQSLNFGLRHLDTFAWIGAFSSAPNTKAPAELVPDPEEAQRMLKLLWISCGDQDGLMSISQGVHAYLKERNVSHIWHVDSGGHTWPVWKSDLYLFSQRIFR